MSCSFLFEIVVLFVLFLSFEFVSLVFSVCLFFSSCVILFVVCCLCLLSLFVLCCVCLRLFVLCVVLLFIVLFGWWCCFLVCHCFRELVVFVCSFVVFLFRESCVLCLFVVA